MGWGHCSFQQISDILMKGVLSPLALFAPGCEPREQASCLYGAELGTRRTWTRGLSLTEMWASPPPSPAGAALAASRLAPPPSLVKLGFHIMLAKALIDLHGTPLLLLHKCMPGSQNSQKASYPCTTSSHLVTENMLLEGPRKTKTGWFPLCCLETKFWPLGMSHFKRDTNLERGKCQMRKTADIFCSIKQLIADGGAFKTRQNTRHAREERKKLSPLALKI